MELLFLNFRKYSIIKRIEENNAKGEYIGTTRGALPYWTKYYLTTTKYDFIRAS